MSCLLHTFNTIESVTCGTSLSTNSSASPWELSDELAESAESGGVTGWLLWDSTMSPALSYGLNGLVL